MGQYLESVKALTFSIFALALVAAHPLQIPNTNKSESEFETADVVSDSRDSSEYPASRTAKFKKEYEIVVQHLPMSVLANITQNSVKELYCMALNNYYEAATEGVTGMRAVSQVVLNRVDEAGFPGTACGVIYQKNTSACQFSWTCQKVLPKLNTESDAWKNAVAVAKDMYLEGEVVHGLEDALFYHASYVSPRWKQVKRVKKIGTHIFYKKKDISV